MKVAEKIMSLGDTIEISAARKLYGEWGIESIKSGVDLPLMTPWWNLVPGCRLFGRQIIPDRRWCDGLVFSLDAGLTDV